tara:strand:+ start:2184 stop:2561 length:378 start_codon:yes stop_codon:yes gene_type:complete
LHTENIVVNREHVEGWSSQRGARKILELDRNLRVVDSGEVASTRWLMLFWLKRKGVRVDTWAWGARVMLVWLHLVKVLTGLFLESVLTVEDQLEGSTGPTEAVAEVAPSSCHDSVPPLVPTTRSG